MRHASSFRDLIVYQKAREAARLFFELSEEFPPEERYSLTDQGRRSSRSIGAQIAEAWAKRGYERHFVSKLTDADGEQQETQHWVDTALDCGYLTKQIRDDLVAELQVIGRIRNRAELLERHLAHWGFQRGRHPGVVRQVKSVTERRGGEPIRPEILRLVQVRLEYSMSPIAPSRGSRLDSSRMGKGSAFRRIRT